jgi:hypothetical protein
MTAPPPFLRVARMLLRWGSVCVLSTMSACVLPIAPEFQDPPASQNYAPTFVNVDPPLGSVVMKNSFLATVSDPNIGDDLYYRWIADYPPYSDNTRTLQPTTKVPHSVDGTLLNADLTVKPDCALYNLAKLPRHQIMVVVADRDFLPPQSSPTEPVDFARLPSDGRKVVGSWILEMECK